MKGYSTVNLSGEIKISHDAQNSGNSPTDELWSLHFLFSTQFKRDMHKKHSSMIFESQGTKLYYSLFTSVTECTEVKKSGGPSMVA